MEFWSTMAALVRRKAVMVPAVLVALALAFLGWAGTPTTYVSSTTMVLTTTEYGGTESLDPTKPTELTNPMLNFNDSLRTTSAIIIQAMGTKTVARQLGVAGTTRLIINDGRTNPDLLGLNGPFLYIEVHSESAAQSRAVVVKAQRLMQDKLDAWQSALNAPQKTYVSLVDVVAPTTPVAGGGHASRVALTAFVLGLVLSLATAHLGQRLLGRRRRARASRVARAAAAGPPIPLARPPAVVTDAGVGGHDHDDRPEREPVFVLANGRDPRSRER